MLSVTSWFLFLQTSSGLSDHHNRPTQGSILAGGGSPSLPLSLPSLPLLSSPVKYPGISAGRALMGPGPVGESLTTVPIQQASQGGGKSVNQQIFGAD